MSTNAGTDRKLNSRGIVIVPFTVRLEEPEYEKLRKRAYDDHMSIAEAVRSAIRRYL